MEYQKICEIRYKKTAEFLQAVGLESKSVSYSRLFLKLKDEWVTMTLEQAEEIAELIVDSKADFEL
jgi:hypothetical protein